ncbi:MAG: peptidase T [Oscillospiraceae bacterium]|nr:peptidase T [Oscillospiraceae bacterium]
MSVLERFLSYIRIDSPSDPKKAGTTPSTEIQLNVADFLAKEMEEMHLENIRIKDGTVYAELPATEGYEDKTCVGFIAHMDTAPEFNGFGIKPQIIENYDGGDVLLAGSGHVLSVKEFPFLSSLKGQKLITTDGTTLLGADDKAGIAEIMEAVKTVIDEKIPHGKVVIAFTPDEEIGHGVDKFDVEGFGAKLAYTVDGGAYNGICYENFNAVYAVVEFNGYSIHPGAAKGKLVNSQNLAFEFHSLLPAFERPENTTDFEGFFHLVETKGTTEKTILEYIVRDHDAVKIDEKQKMMKDIAEFINTKYGEGSCVLTLTEQYRNMKEKILPFFEVVEYAENAIRALGAQPVSEAARGGTDGAMLSYKGLPCPNLGTGGYNAHGRYECITEENLEKCTQVVIEIIRQFAK